MDGSTRPVSVQSAGDVDDGRGHGLEVWSDDIECLAGWRKDQPGPSSERSGCSRSNRSCHIPRGQRLEPAHRLGLPELPTPVAFRVRHRQAVLDRVADLSDGDNLLGAA